MEPPKGGRPEPATSKGTAAGSSRAAASPAHGSIIAREREVSPNPVSRSYQPGGHVLATSMVRLNVSGEEEEFVSTGNATSAYRTKANRQSRDMTKELREKEKSPAPLREALVRVKALLPKNEADAKSHEEPVLQHVASALEKVFPHIHSLPLLMK